MVHQHPSRRPLVFLAVAVLVAVVLAGLALWGASPVEAQGGTVKLEWLSWSFFRFSSPKGKVIVTNPFMAGNPDATVTLADLTRADLILVPNGHRDEIGQAADVAKKTGAKIVSPFELCTWFIGKGVPEAQVDVRRRGTLESYF